MPTDIKSQYDSVQLDPTQRAKFDTLTNKGYSFDKAIEIATGKVADPTISTTTSSVPVRDARVSPSDSVISSLLGENTSAVSDVGTQREMQKKAAEEALNTRLLDIENRVSQKLAEEQKLGERELARTRGINVRSGLQGSTFGEAFRTMTEEKTKEAKEQVRQMGDIERAKAQSDFNTALTQFDERATARLDALRQERSGLILKRYELSKQDQQAAQENLKTFASSGRVTIDQMKSTGALDEFSKQLGKTPQETELLFNSYLPKEQASDYKFQEVGSDVYVWQFDPITRQFKRRTDLDITGGAKGLQEYDAKEIGGALYLVPKKIDPTKPLDKQVLTFGGTGTGISSADMATTDPTSKSILAQTGLSYNAFLVLSGKMSQLPRDQVTRNRAAKEAEAFSKRTGTDVSTFAAQYEAYNDTLQANIKRLNNTKIMESEIIGTIENLEGVVNDKDLSKLRFANVAKVWAGQEVNDSLAQQYAMHLYQLRNELAAYGAATQGRNATQITLQDYQEAERAIKNGISKGSLDGLKTAVENSTGKMGTVMEKSVDRSQKAIWDLFGVGKNYQNKAQPTQMETIKQKAKEQGYEDVDSAIKIYGLEAVQKMLGM